MKLIIDALTKQFDDKKVLNNVSFQFEKGKIYGLLGRNGAGKTTLFNCINEDLKFEQGQIKIDENGVLRQIESDDIGYVLATPIVPDFLTGREFIQFFCDINKKRLDPTKTLDDYFDMVGLEWADQNRLIRDYSHGMKNKIQMLIHIIARPAILLLDEPLTSLDVIVAEEMKNLLRSIKESHIIILSTHIMELALDLCDEIVVLHNGVLAQVEHAHLDNTEYKNLIFEQLKG